ncbi:peptidoglycan DD-metalloendopeptidase family protein [Paenibacillus alkalitolerans]|uniref:peptidoglycan DD-metalloendopeptidase family protein n=1 Tax=Paenibacillus alkalitolerans TaxID=2799335 RepID=UPI0018F3383D|nr:peptidoglycan DD-metalloendopeptidase family protein [Paenibacillus alkalitolerans]
MDRKDELRKRRERRIQHILSSEGDRYDDYGPPETHLYPGYYEHDRRLREDPEYLWYHRTNPWRGPSPGFTRTLRIQTALSVVVLAAVWALFQWDHPVLARTQSFVTASLTEELPFEQFAAWYRDKLGNMPAFIPALDRSGAEARKADASPAREYALPAIGNVVEPFGSVRAGAGIVLRTGPGAGVSAMDTGMVTFVGETSETGMTVAIRHPGGVQTVYGHLGKVNVTEDDWVDAGEKIGSVKGIGGDGSDGMLYFAVNRNGGYVNPLDVVSLD